MSIVDLQSCKEKLEEYIEKEIQFYKDGGSPKIVIVALEEVLEKVVAFKKDYVIVPRKKLEELLKKQPIPRHADDAGFIEEIEQWLKDLHKLLEVSK